MAQWLSTRLPPMWPGFDSRTRRHMWVEFVVGSRPCSEGFSPGSPVFLSPQNPTFPNSNSTWNTWTPLNEFLELFGVSWVNKLHLQQSEENYSNKRTDLALVHVTDQPWRDVLCRVWFLHCTLCTEPVETTETNDLNKFTNNKTTKTGTLNTAWK